MKIAFSTEDGKHISQSYAWAPYYLVLSIDGDRIMRREMRLKMSNMYLQSKKYKNQSGETYCFTIAAQGNYSWMAQGIADCDALIARGIGAKAQGPLHILGIEPISTDKTEIDQALHEYLHRDFVPA
jgi:predicted Fe-Mo cluster-binding NifX family protein